MADLIKVPYTELFRRAQIIRDQADIVYAQINTLAKTMESLNWMGQRKDKFTTMWNNDLPAMYEWVSTLKGFADELERQANRMQAADQSF
jgi:WXG100 family type VII secretion target